MKAEKAVVPALLQDPEKEQPALEAIKGALPALLAKATAQPLEPEKAPPTGAQPSPATTPNSSKPSKGSRIRKRSWMHIEARRRGGNACG